MRFIWTPTKPPREEPLQTRSILVHKHINSIHTQKYITIYIDTIMLSSFKRNKQESNNVGGELLAS